MYKPTKWENRVYDEQGNILKDGTGLWAEYLNNMEEGIVGAYKRLSNLVEKEDGKGLSTNDFTDYYKNEITKLPNYLQRKVEKEDGKGLSSNDFTKHYIDIINDNKQSLANINSPLGLVKLNDKGLIPSHLIPANLKENMIVGSVNDLETIQNKFAGLRVTVINKEKGSWQEYMYDGTEFVKLSSSDDMDITIDWQEIVNKPNSFVPSEHGHTERDIVGLDKYTKAEVDSKLKNKAEKSHIHTESDIDGLDKYTRAQVDAKLKDKSNTNHLHTEKDITDLDKYTKKEVDDKVRDKLTPESNIIQTVYNAIGWEKNILFKADERFAVIEHNTKVGKGNYQTFFDGGLDPISIPNVNKDNPYIIEITGLPQVNTQGKGFIGFVSRFRFPKDFKVEWFNSRDSKWEVLAEETNWNKPYFYSDNFTGSASKIKLTFTRVQGDDFLQLAQIVFINPEAAIMYDHLLAKDYDLKVFGESLAKLESILDTVVKVKHDHSNKDVLDKVAYTGSKTQLNLEDIYSHSHNWDGIKNKPTEFKPGEHTHSIGEVTNLQATLDSLESKIESGGGAVTSVNGKTGDVVLYAMDIDYMPGLDMSLFDAFGAMADEVVEVVTEAMEDMAKKDHTHSEYAKITDLPENFDILKKLVDLGNNSQIDLDLIYTHKHSYNEIQNKPTIPNKITDLDDDINLVSSDIPRDITISESSPINPKEGSIWIRI